MKGTVTVGAREMTGVQGARARLTSGAFAMILTRAHKFVDTLLVKRGVSFSSRARGWGRIALRLRTRPSKAAQLCVALPSAPTGVGAGVGGAGKQS